MRGRIGARGERALLVAAWVAQLAILILVAAHHEPWRDEADVWLFARDAAFGDWRYFFQHSGSPPLWHLLVMPLARNGFPYASMIWLNVAIVSVGVAIFLRFAPLPLALKLLFPFGVLPLFEYGVVARSYGLSFTLLMAICAALSAQRQRPVLIGLLLALLANTNAHSFLVAAGLGLFWLLEALRARKPGAPLLSRGTWIGMAIAAAGAVVVVLLLWPPDDPQSFERESHKSRVLFSVLRDAFFPAFSRFPGGVLGDPVARRDPRDAAPAPRDLRVPALVQRCAGRLLPRGVRRLPAPRGIPVAGRDGGALVRGARAPRSTFRSARAC